MRHTGKFFGAQVKRFSSDQLILEKIIQLLTRFTENNSSNYIVIGLVFKQNPLNICEYRDQFEEVVIQDFHFLTIRFSAPKLTDINIDATQGIPIDRLTLAVWDKNPINFKPQATLQNYSFTVWSVSESTSFQSIWEIS